MLWLNNTKQNTITTLPVDIELALERWKPMLNNNAEINVFIPSVCSINIYSSLPIHIYLDLVPHTTYRDANKTENPYLSGVQILL